MIISHQHQFIFLKTQKTAGTSVELALSEICGPDDVITRVSGEDEAKRKGLGPQNETIPVAYRRRDWRLRALLRLNRSAVGKDFYNHMPAIEVRRSMTPSLFDAYKKITIVRNPWDREVSRYYWTYRGKEGAPTFDQFVRRYRHRPERKNFELYSIDGRVVADIVLRYESLEADFNAFVASLGVSPAPELPRAKARHRTQDARKNYRELYTPETVDIVRRRYAREIAAFGYEF